MKNSALIKYLFALILFGSYGIVASYISLTSLEIVLLRTLIGSLLLIILFFLSGRKLSFYRYKKQFAFLCVSGVAMGESWMFLYEAYFRIGVSIATLLYYCGPVIVMVLSPLLFKEKLTVYKIIGLILVVIGVFLTNGSIPDGKRDIFGVVCGLMSAVTYAIMVIFNKKSNKIAGLENAVLQLLTAFLTVAVFVAIKQGLYLHISGVSIFPILVLGLLNTGIGCYLYFSSIGKIPVQTVAVLGYLEPLSAVILSVIFLKEEMLPFQIIGAVLILGGAIIGENKISPTRKGGFS